MGPGRDRTRDPWICSQTRTCSQTRYPLRYAARPGANEISNRHRICTFGLSLRPLPWISGFELFTLYIVSLSWKYVWTTFKTRPDVWIISKIEPGIQDLWSGRNPADTRCYNIIWTSMRSNDVTSRFLYDLLTPAMIAWSGQVCAIFSQSDKMISSNGVNVIHRGSYMNAHDYLIYYSNWV